MKFIMVGDIELLSIKAIQVKSRLVDSDNFCLPRTTQPLMNIYFSGKW